MHVLRVDPDGTQQLLTGFDAVAGRDTWYAGSAIVDGKLMGPPLGIRSMSATCSGAVLLANVHVGGVPRSTDFGLTWRPTIDIDCAVHQVCAHQTRPGVVIAAAGTGLCVSRDAGKTWSRCFGGNRHFRGSIDGPVRDARRSVSTPIDSNGPLQLLGGGLPKWIDGIADTSCIATRDSTVAVIDGAGSLYVSRDDGASWSIAVERLPVPSGLHIC